MLMIGTRKGGGYFEEKLVGAPGFGPGTSCAQGRRATRLRYAPTRQARFLVKSAETIYSAQDSRLLPMDRVPVEFPKPALIVPQFFEKVGHKSGHSPRFFFAA